MDMQRKLQLQNDKSQNDKSQNDKSQHSRFRINWRVVPTAMLSVLAMSLAAAAQVTTPLSGEQVISGTSGGTQASACGFIANRPVQTVRVTEAFTSLRFRVEGAGRPTLLILGADGSVKGCARATNFSNGVIEASGAWERGNYSVFVGDLDQGSRHDFRLSIVQN
ncbi:MAG: hypothetical protein Fur0046_02240 [Cyanobacteria bacterium J069]